MNVDSIEGGKWLKMVLQNMTDHILGPGQIPWYWQKKYTCIVQ